MSHNEKLRHPNSHIFLSSCCKAYIDSETLLNNTTNDKIELRFYNNSVLTTSFLEGKSTIVAFYKLPYAVADSVQIFVKDTYQQTHYSQAIHTPSVSTNVLQFAHPRNILNINNYEKVREELSCNGSYTKYSYSF